MKAAVIVFPGSNCDRDVAVALAGSNITPTMVWHKGSELPKVDLIVVPGGFSYGDYLRSGAMAARSPIMREVISAAGKGTHVLGICNGFQILTESGLLPGTLMRNKHLKFICREVQLRVASTGSAYTEGYAQGQVIRMPIAHHDGCYYADSDTLARLEDNQQIAFKYNDNNPNGSLHDIAGIVNKEKNVLGMMPHPERIADALTGGIDGKVLFDSVVRKLG